MGAISIVIRLIKVWLINFAVGPKEGNKKAHNNSKHNTGKHLEIKVGKEFLHAKSLRLKVNIKAGNFFLPEIKSAPPFPGIDTPGTDGRLNLYIFLGS